MTESCEHIENYCTFHVNNITANTFDLNINLDTLVPAPTSNNYIQGAEILFSGVELASDTNIVPQTFLKI